MKDRIPFRARPMLASLTATPFHKTGWVYEEKYDGYRLLAYKEGARVTLLSRNDKDKTAGFPLITAAVAAMPDRTLLLDGEAVVFDRAGISRFQLLQQGAAAVHFAVFDCLYRDGHDLRGEPLSRRRQALEAALGADKVCFVSRRLAKNGLAAFEQARKKGFEGMLAKDEASPYAAGRSRAWLKIKVHQEEEFVIAGYTAPAGARDHFGALLLGAHDRQGNLQFVGKVGTGFTRGSLAELYSSFRPLRQQSPAFVNPPRERDVTWLQPKLVAQIAFQEWTADKKLRQPVFLGIRDDKSPKEALLPD